MRIDKRGYWTLSAAAFALGLLFALSCLADTLRGTLRQVAPRARRIVVKDADGDDNHLRVAANARITLNGRRATLDELRAGDQVVVVFSEDADGNAVATVVEASRPKGTGM